MSKINIKGVELEINVLDADTAEKMENAMEHVRIKSAEFQADKSMKLSAGIRAVCQLVFECFNSIFGDGTDKRIFGNHTDMGECMEAFAELARQTKQEGKERVSSITQKYAPNREARRAQKK